MIYYFDLHKTRVFGPMFRKSGVVHRNPYRGFIAMYAMYFKGLYKLPSAYFYPRPKFVDGDDKIIVFDSYATPRLVNWLCGKWPDKRIIFWYWNSAYNLQMREKVPERVEFWSYSRADCKTYGFRHNTQFFFDCLAEKAAACRAGNKRNPVPKALFIGREKGRAAALDALREQFRAAGVEADFQLVPRPKGRFASSKEKLLSYQAVVDRVADADILVDYYLDPDSGLSLRPLEAMFFGKKLVTNSREILSADFYSPANIYVLGHDTRTLREFVETPGTEVAPRIRDRYLLSNWLKRFDEAI